MTKYLEACKWLYSFNNKCLRKKFGSNFFTNFTFPCHVNTLYELAEKTQWIPCSERLPDEVGEYLQTIEMLDGSFEIDIDSFEDGRWNYHDMDVVKAWMPLPEPYKGGDE